MLTATARASLQRVTALPLRPLVAARTPVLATAAHARPFSATAWAGGASKVNTMQAKKEVAREAAREKKLAAAEKRKVDKEAKAKARDEARAKKKEEGAEKKKKKRALTPEEKAKAEVKELKERALLKEPRKSPDTAWKVYVSQELKGASVGQDLAGSTRAVSERFKNLSTSELEVRQDSSLPNPRIPTVSTHSRRRTPLTLEKHRASNPPRTPTAPPTPSTTRPGWSPTTPPRSATPTSPALPSAARRTRRTARSRMSGCPSGPRARTRSS